MIEFSLNRDFVERAEMGPDCGVCPQPEARRVGRGIRYHWKVTRSEAELLFEHLEDVAFDSGEYYDPRSKVPQEAEQHANELRDLIDNYVAKANA